MTLLEKLKKIADSLGADPWRRDGHCVVVENKDPDTRQEYVDIVIADCGYDPLDESEAASHAEGIVAMNNYFPALLESVSQLGHVLECRNAGRLEEVDWDRLAEIYGKFTSPTLRMGAKP